jgi:hypothetical protein
VVLAIIKLGPGDDMPMFRAAKERAMSRRPTSRLERFKEATRELEADDDAARFEARLGRIITRGAS